MKKTGILICATLFLSAHLFSQAKIFMLRNNGPLRKANESNGVEWAESVPAGTELELESPETEKKDLITSSKTYPAVSFYKVKYKNESYYVQESDVEKGDYLSVLQSDSVLFTKPTLSSFRNAILDAGTLVVIGEAIPQLNKTFVKISFYDTNDGLKRIRYVDLKNVSNSDKDVKAVILLEAARETKNEDLQKELLENVKQIKKTPLIEEYVSKEIARILNVSSFSDDSIMQVDNYIAYITTADSSKVNVRSLPGTAGEIIAQFDSASRPAIMVSMKTEETEEIDGISESWYYVTELDSETFEQKSEGIEGWVFGGFIKEN